MQEAARLCETPEETAYIERLRKKYAVAERKLGVEAALKIIRSACGFITRADNAPKGLYDSEEAELLLLGTALVESDLAPRFQQSRGDAIGLFQIEYGTFRDHAARQNRRRSLGHHRAGRHGAGGRHR